MIINISSKNTSEQIAGDLVFTVNQMQRKMKER